MNTKEFQDLLGGTFDSLNAISASKGQEYANSADRLANFKRLSARLGLAPEAVLLVYLTKHLDSIDSYVKELGSVEIRNRRALSEPIEGRIDDAILYLILLKGLIQERTRISEGTSIPISIRGPLSSGNALGGEPRPGSLPERVDVPDPGRPDMVRNQMVTAGRTLT